MSPAIKLLLGMAGILPIMIAVLPLVDPAAFPLDVVPEWVRIGTVLFVVLCYCYSLTKWAVPNE